MKKMKSSKINKKRQEFIEQDNERDQLAAQMRAAQLRGASLASNPDRSVDDDAVRNPGASFEDKLAAVREKGAAVREAREASAPTLMDDMIAGGQGGKKRSTTKSIYDAPASSAKDAPAGISFSQVGAKTDEDEGLQTLIRVGSGILAVGLLLVFLPSDLTASSPVQAPQKELTAEVLQQVKDRAAEYEKQLASENQGDVLKGLKGAAESYVVLEDYLSAAPLLQRLYELEPSIENTGNLADVWSAAGKPAKAAEAYRVAVNAEWSGVKPNPTLLKGLVDALSKDGRHGLALSYVNDWRTKGTTDDIDASLLEARVYSGWKGHGKDAEESYTRVIAEHPDDFRGYLAKGVFFREIGKPSEADNLFRQAKALVPKDLADVVNVVVKQAKQQN
jgi:tetratricopeptide (TPR) repeat protein